MYLKRRRIRPPAVYAKRWFLTSDCCLLGSLTSWAPARAAGRPSRLCMYSCITKLTPDGVEWARQSICIWISQRGAFEINPVTTVNDTIENGVGQRWIVKIGMPGFHRQLAGNQS